MAAGRTCRAPPWALWVGVSPSVHVGFCLSAAGRGMYLTPGLSLLGFDQCSDVLCTV